MRIFIIAVTFVVVAATIGTILVGSRTFDGVVVDRPYEAGLAWDETQKRQARLGWQVVVEPSSLRTGANVLVLRLSERDGTLLNGASVDVTISRPSTKDYDRTYRAQPLGGGRYRVSPVVPLIGWWDVRMTVVHGADTYTVIERMEAQE